MLHSVRWSRLPIDLSSLGCIVLSLSPLECDMAWGQTVVGYKRHTRPICGGYHTFLRSHISNLSLILPYPPFSSLFLPFPPFSSLFLPFPPFSSLFLPFPPFSAISRLWSSDLLACDAFLSYSSRSLVFTVIKSSKKSDST
jgi:hypothetical protein